MWSGGYVSHTAITYRVLIQSERSAAYLESRIENFLADFKSTLKEMPDEDFKKHVTSQINKKLEKVKNLTQESGRYWMYIGDEFYDFFQRKQPLRPLSLTR